MKLEKNTTILLFTIILITINCLIFLLNDSLSSTQWLSYGTIHLAYVISLLVVMRVSIAKTNAVYGYPVIYWIGIFFLMELILGLVFIFLKYDSYKLPLIVHILVFAFFITTLFIKLISEKDSIAKDIEDAKNIFLIKDSIYKLEEAMQKVQDPALKREIENLYDEFRSAQVKTIPEVIEDEQNLTNNINNITGSLPDKQTSEFTKLIKESIILLQTRNNKIKLSRR